MRSHRYSCVAALAGCICIAAPAFSRFAAPALLVGPQISRVSPPCLSIEAPGGATLGSGVPIAGLALGALVERNPTSFPTGGSGTANLILEEERKAAGLQWEPKTFDPIGKEKPSVFTGKIGRVREFAVYQRLLLKSSKATVLPYGLVYASTVSADAGRIVSVGLNVPAKPVAKPRVRITAKSSDISACPTFLPVEVFAPDMSAAQIERLFGSAPCNWNDPDLCEAADRPRGQVLFVQQLNNGLGFENRWIDYDLLYGRSVPGHDSK